MPSFLDRHNATGATATDLAEAHRLDLEAQAIHDVSFLAYWFDEGRGMACCLADAPSAQAVMDVHSDSHGQVPADIIEVEKDEVLAFLGRISEPTAQEVASSAFVPDSAFRTIMMTDIVDSVGFTVRVGQGEAVERFSAHDETVRGAIAKRHGRIVKHTGDGFLAAFDNVDDALWAADEIHTGLVNVDEELRVRIGVNPGNPVDRGGDLFGLAVQIAARLCGQADVGQTLMSGVTKDLCQDPSLRARCRDAGRVPLKGLPSAIHAYSLDAQP
jgi:class 3 adenylate cyclase